MKRLLILLSGIAMCACQDTNDGFDNIDVINAPFEEMIGSQQGDFDKEELERQLSECAYVHEICYEKVDKGWKVWSMIGLGSGCIYGFVVKEGTMTTFGGNPPFVEDGKKNHDCRYSSENATVYTVKMDDGKEYAAKVVYYKDGCVVFEGCLPFNYCYDEVPETYLYKGYFSKEKKDEWENSDHWVDR